MASSGTIEKKFHGGSTGGYYIGIDWRIVSQDKTSNSSIVHATAYIRASGSGYTINSSVKKNITLTVNGTQFSGTSLVGLTAGQKRVLLNNENIKVPHNSDGTKTCTFAMSAVVGLTLSGTYYGTISHSGSATLDKINLNSAPYWGTNDDTHIQLNGTAIKSHVTIPENTGNVTVVACAASDKETPNALHYDIHRYVNGNYSAKIKSGGNGRTVVDNLSSWGQGTQFKYEVKVHDGSLWVSNPASRVSWTYTKNTFTRASVDSIGSIGVGTTTVGFRAHSIRNSGGGNGYVSNNFGYRIESLTSGVTIGGNATHKQENANALNFVLGVKNNGGNPTNPHWLDANELKNVLRNSNYCGNIKLRLVSWNDYGSQGSYDFNIWVDLRQNPDWTTITYDANNAITHGGVSYYIPAHLPFKFSWNAVRDPVEGNACTYEVGYQIGDAGYVWLGTTSSTTYTAYLGSTAIGNSKQTNFRIIVRAKTRYGNYSDSGGARVTLWDYAPPTVRITETSRNQGNAVAKGTITVNSSIPNITLTNTHWRWLGGSNTNYKASTTNQKVNNFTITATVNDDFAGTMHVASSDSVRDLIEAKVSIYWDSAETTFKGYMPVMSLNRYGLGVGTRLENSSYKFAVDGNANIIGNLHINGSPISNNNIVSRGNVTCETGTNRPALNGVSMSQVYNNGYPTTYGNVLTLKGAGDGQLLIGWSGTSGAHAPVYVRSKRDTSDASWSGWAQIYTTANKPTPGDIGAAASSHSHSYLPLSGGTMTGGIQLHSNGGSWLNGATNGNLKGSKQSTGSYHPIISQTTSSNHKISLGGLGDDFGFHLYDANRTANGYDKYFRFRLSDKTVHTDCRTFINEWLYFPSGYGIYFNGNDGGLYMSDSTWLRSYNGKSLYTGSGTIYTDGTVKCAVLDDRVGAANTCCIDNANGANSQITLRPDVDNKGNLGHKNFTWNYANISGVGSTFSIDRETSYDVTRFNNNDMMYDMVKNMNFYLEKEKSVEEFEEEIELKQTEEYMNADEEEQRVMRMNLERKTPASYYYSKRTKLVANAEELPFEVAPESHVANGSRTIEIGSFVAGLASALQKSIGIIEELENKVIELENKIDEIKQDNI